MNNKILKFFLNILLISTFIPSSIFAATHNSYHEKIENVSNATLGTYYLGNNVYVPKNIVYHEIVDGSNIYLAYCLDHELAAPIGSSGNITSSTTLTNQNGVTLTTDQINILKNIFASGFQYSGNVSNLLNASSTTKKTMFATQILIWEVMNGARNDYSTNLNSNSPSSYDFVKTDSELKSIYENILTDASKLAGNIKPSSFDKTYTLHYNDSKEAYTLNGDISVGEYTINTYDTSKLSAEISNTVNHQNYISISTKKSITTPEKITFKYVKGTTLNDANEFKWFVFNDVGVATQKVALAYYQGISVGELSVKTESGKFKITKKDSSTNKNLKGAVFALDKCKKITDCSKIATINMKDKEVSDDITINKSGWYRLRETTVPFGYEKMSDVLFLLQITDDGKVKMSVDKGYNFISQEAATDTKILNIIVKEDSKNFSIKKIDGRTNKEIKGTTFQIKKIDGTLIKFKEDSNGKYTYSKNGNITELYSENLSTYTVSLLPEGEYILEEINVSYPYVLSTKEEERSTKFKIDSKDYLQTLNSKNKYVKDADVTITVKNYQTRVVITKTGLKSKPVEGVIFELYDKNKNSQIPLRFENNEYIYDIQGSPTQLTTNSKGKIIINYLKEGTYYLKEVQTPSDSGLVIDPNNQWTKIKVTLNEKSYNILKNIRNDKGSFCFYKIDEDGNYLSSGKFKLQVYDEKNSRYKDVALKFNDDKTYSIDDTSKNNIYVFSPISSGETCFTNINAKGKYKIVEIEAPEGYILSKSNETDAEITINEYGYAIGDAVIINRKIRVGEGKEAQAELIISIQTGRNKISYIIISIAVISIIATLLILKKKIDKK